MLPESKRSDADGLDSQQATFFIGNRKGKVEFFFSPWLSYSLSVTLLHSDGTGGTATLVITLQVTFCLH